MLLWSASNWDMLTLEVSGSTDDCDTVFKFTFPVLQLHIAMPTLVLVLDPSTWMMLLVLQVLASYWNALADQSLHMTVFTLLMLV